jgi:hypothetical protein
MNSSLDPASGAGATQARHPQPLARPEMPGVKVRCESPSWSAKLQDILREDLGCTWGEGFPTPWNTERPYLVIRRGVTGRWFICWASPDDFETCPLPLFTARGLVQAWKRLHPTKASPASRRSKRPADLSQRARGTNPRARAPVNARSQ